MNYYISDVHFFAHSQAGEQNLDGRPYKTLEEMHTDLLKRWNAKITNGDTVYILGDLSIRGGKEPMIALVSQLKGRKVLILGNHDDVSDYRYKQLFSEIYDYKEITDSIKGQQYKLVLSHYPILMWNGQHRGTIHLYGHVHGTAEDAYYQKCLRRMNEDPEIRKPHEKPFCAINVGCMKEYMDYEPRSLKELLNALSFL